MGCDIHMCLEYRPRHNEYIEGTKQWVTTRGQWTSADLFRKPTLNEREIFGETREYVMSDVYSDRNYALFSLLAGVRDYDMPINMDSVISHGTPNDCCTEVAEELNRWNSCGHTYRYCTLDQLIDWYDKYSAYQPKIASEQFEPAIEGLHTLIDSIENQLDRLCIIWKFEFENPTQLTKDKIKDVRVVFWFDD